MKPVTFVENLTAIEQNRNNGEEEIQKMKENARRKRGRGFELDSVINRNTERNYDELADMNDDLEDNGPKRSVEGWILFATNIHEEAEADDLLEKFSAFGPVKNIHLNLDRRTGYIKGYALVEYETFKEAKTAKIHLNKSKLLGQEITVDWCIMKKSKRVSPITYRNRR